MKKNFLFAKMILWYKFFLLGISIDPSEECRQVGPAVLLIFA
jgi:hypothetical protein